LLDITFKSDSLNFASFQGLYYVTLIFYNNKWIRKKQKKVYLNITGIVFDREYGILIMSEVGGGVGGELLLPLGVTSRGAKVESGNVLLLDMQYKQYTRVRSRPELKNNCTSI
jgi:hypothetical protein